MDLNERIFSIIENIQKLRTICYPDNILPIEYLTIFSHSEEDFQELRSQLQKDGDETEANNGYKYQLSNILEYKGESISLVRIRKPDIHRPELGCGDLTYEENDYPILREIALKKGLDIILRDGYEMIELSDFNINVYAYLVKDL